MIGFSQTNDLTAMFTLDSKGQTNQSSSTTANFCDEIDEIMKHEQEDTLSLDNSLSTTPIDLDLDSISDLLDTSRSTSTSFAQSLTIDDLSPTFTSTNTTTTTSAYSSLSTSPKFTHLSLNHNPFQPFPFLHNSHLPSYLPSQNTSRSFDFQTDTSGPLDVKRFRSASMNDGPTLYPQQNQLDPYRFKSSAYMNPPPIDPSTNPTWPLMGNSRPTSTSFSEVENQQQQQRLNPLSATGRMTSSTIYYRHPSRLPNNGQFSQQTLYSINQSTSENLTPPTKKRLSLVDFPVEEIKDDPSSPSCTIEQQSEADLWSDIDQTSSDLLHENDNTSDDDDDDDDDEINTSGDYSKAFGNSTSPPRFWKYNVQSKGPKTKRMLYLKERDPHLHREFSDPVHQIRLTQTTGQTFNKLRKGDGNDVTPNPLKLYQLGKQIRDLLKNTSSLYHGIYHVEHQSTANDSIEAKKEKNKLASKTCRLRKKAQHEANKLKLQGLNEEHKSLIEIIASIKLIILQRYEADNDHERSSSMEAALDRLIATKYGQSVAGNTDGFVEATINEMENLYSQSRS